MKDVKIAFFDIDGTLIDMNKRQISDKMLATLRALKKQNILLCIATGRSPIALPHFKDVAFDAFLTFNGSYCFNQNESIYENPIPPKDVATIIENSRALNRPVAIATKNRTIANGTDTDLSDYFAFANQAPVISKSFNATVKNEQIYQLMLGSRAAEHAKVMQHTTNSKITAWWNRAVDIIPGNGGKEIGIGKIRRLLTHVLVPDIWR